MEALLPEIIATILLVILIFTNFVVVWFRKLGNALKNNVDQFEVQRFGKETVQRFLFEAFALFDNNAEPLIDLGPQNMSIR